MKDYLKRIVENSLISIGLFIDKLGFDEDEYMNTFNVPINRLVEDLPNGYCCKYIPPFKTIKTIKASNEDEFYEFLDRGVLVISTNNIVEDEVFSTTQYIKELYLANNIFFIEDYKFTPNYKEHKMDRITEDKKIYIPNYFSDILKNNNIDFCLNSVKKYKNLDMNELEKDNSRILMIQQKLYSVLLFMMSFSSYELLCNPKTTIKETLIDFIKVNKDSNEIDAVLSTAIATFIVQDNSYEIFKCIIDPITYSLGDIHYNILMSYFNVEEQTIIYSLITAGLENKTYIKRV